jgi:hypothetical protein
LLGRRRQIRPPGLFALHVAGYSGFRIFEELLRVDAAHRILDPRLNFLVATLLCLAGAAWFVRSQGFGVNTRRHRSRGGPAAFGIALLACVLVGCGHKTVWRGQPKPPRPSNSLAAPAAAPRGA